VTQSPIHGVSFLHTFDDAAAATHHVTQYFEMFGHRAIDHDGWRAVCPWPGPSFAEAGAVGFGTPITAEMLGRLDNSGWELYHVAADPAETHDLAGENRDKLIELISTWYVQAGQYGVLPIDGSGLQRAMTERPQVAETRDQYMFWPGTQTVPFFAGPRVLNRPHAITADATIPPEARTASCSVRAPRSVAGRST
jgi:arylsulfatase